VKTYVSWIDNYGVVWVRTHKQNTPKRVLCKRGLNDGYHMMGITTEFT